MYYHHILLDADKRIGRWFMITQNLGLLTETKDYLMVRAAQRREADAVPRPGKGTMQMAVENMAQAQK